MLESMLMFFEKLRLLKNETRLVRTMETINKSWVLSLLLLPLTSCLMTSKDSIVLSQLRRAAEIIDRCDIKEDESDREMACIILYANTQNVDAGIFLADIYGGRIVLSSKGKCPSGVKYPYSKGPNGKDECGKGDDISL